MLQSDTIKNSPDDRIAYKSICIYFILALLTLLVLIKIAPAKFISDERDFIPNLKVLGQYGLSRDFLRGIVGQSPGPLYQFIYYPIGKAIPLTPFIIRIVNFFFLLIDMALIGLLAKADARKNIVIISLLILGIPMTWTISGMAFTELPSLLFCLLSILLLKKALNTTKAGTAAILSLLAGFSAGVGIIGRSPFLMLIPAAMLLFILPGKRLAVLLFMLAASVFPFIVFSAWGGLVPPNVQGIQSGYNLWYLLLCITYFAFSTIIVYPQFFILNKRHYYIAIGLIIVFVVLNAVFFKVKYTPMNGVLTSKRIPSFISEIYPYLFQSFTVGCSYLFIVSLYFDMIKNKKTTWDFFMLAIAGLIAFTTIKSAAHFTSKYVMQAYPFFLLYIASGIKVNRSLLLRVIIGSIIGMVTLYSYYAIHSALSYRIIPVEL